MFIFEFLNYKKYKHRDVRFGRMCFMVSNNNCHNTRYRNVIDMGNISVYVVVLMVETFNQKEVDYRVVGAGNLSLWSLDELRWFQSYANEFLRI